MKLRESTLLNRTGKMFALPLSRLAVSRFLYEPLKALDAYLNFLLGKGSGSGWDRDSEVNAALFLTHRSEPVILDVGANVGSWAEGFLAAKPAAKVFMFEPLPGCRDQIANKQSLRNAQIVPAAVGEQAGKARIYVSESTDESASLYPRKEVFFKGRTYSELEVDVVAIDDVIKNEQLEFVDFLKMDIEGHELFALHGAKDALREHRIGALLFEFGSGNINSRTFFREFWDILTSSGFRIWRIAPGGRLVAITEYYEDLEYFRGVSNYVAELKDHPYAKHP
jgi:FkbM family methyltransferase